MSTQVSTVVGDVAETRIGLGQTVMVWVRNALAQVGAYMQHQRDLAMLGRMDERLLRDAGLSRYDLERWPQRR